MLRPVEDTARLIERLVGEACAALAARGLLPPDLGAVRAAQLAGKRGTGDFICRCRLASATEADGLLPEAAAAICRELPLPDGVLSGAELSDGGVINFRLSDAWFDHALDEIIKLGDGGCGLTGNGGSVLAAFVCGSGTGTPEALRGDVLTENFASACRCAGFKAASERFEDDLAAHGGAAGRLAASYDRIIKASELDGGYMDETLAALEERGLAVWKNGAAFLPVMEGGAGEARLLRGPKGAYSSFALKLAYLRLALSEKAFDRVVVVLSGAGGGGKAECQALRQSLSGLGADADRLEFILLGGVRLIGAGSDDSSPEELLELCRKSRAAADSVRFMLGARPEAPAALDMDLAARSDAGNPAYRIQYAHARLCRMLKAADRAGQASAEASPAKPYAEDERELIKKLALFPDKITRAAKTARPFIINRYLSELAALFYEVYRAGRFTGPEGALSASGIRLARAVKAVLGAGLGLLGMEAPE